MSARAVATACARGLVSAPSITSTPFDGACRPTGPPVDRLVACPGARPADPSHLSDRTLRDQLPDRGHGVRAERLEADLADDPQQRRPRRPSGGTPASTTARAASPGAGVRLARGDQRQVGVGGGMGVQITAIAAGEVRAPKSADWTVCPFEFLVERVSSPMPPAVRAPRPRSRRMFSRCQRPWPRAPARTTGSGESGGRARQDAAALIPSPPRAEAGDEPLLDEGEDDDNRVAGTPR